MQAHDAGAAPITGRVTDGTVGIGGVLVSDGLQVARTDADGRYALPGTGPFVVVTRPTGWTTDRWYVRRDAEDHDVVLRPVEQPLPLTFVQVTDLHVSLGETASAPDGSDATFYLGNDLALHERVVTSPEVIAALWDDIATQVPEAAFVAATGDLTNTGSDDEYRAYVASIAASAIAVVSIPGNHDHHAQDGEVPEDVTSADFHAVPDRYEAHLGPRWFSFDHAGLHVVVIDWFTHLLGIDADVQEAWLHADLTAIPGDQPVVLLSHDLMPSAFFDRLPRRPIATFSGHWHTSRVVRANGTLHVNTPTATFGGLDYSPAAFRVVTWDGAEIGIETVTRTTPDAASPAPRAATYRAHGSSGTEVVRLPGAGHRSTPVIAGDLVLCTTRDEDRPAGWLTAVDRRSGAIAWEHPLDSAIKSSPTVVDDAVITTAVTGETLCVGLDGVERWRRELDDPLRLWAYLRPVCDSERVFVGDVARYAALDLHTGATVWQREDLGQRENLTSYADPVIADGTLVLAFAGQTPTLHGLDPATGSSRWPLGTEARSIYRLSPAQVATELPRTVAGPLVVDRDGTDVYVVRLGSVLERIRAADGTSVWMTAHHGWFNPGALAVAGDLVIAPIGTGRVRAYDRSTGALRWDTSVGEAAALAAGAYRATGALSLGALAVGDDTVLVTTGDGTVMRLDLAGEVQSRTDLGAPALGGVAIAGTAAWTITADGALHRIDLR